MVARKSLAISVGVLTLALGALTLAPHAAAISSCTKLTASNAFAPMVDTDGDGRYDGIQVSIRVTLLTGVPNASGSLIIALERPIGTSVASQGTPDFSIAGNETYAWDPIIHITETQPEGNYTVRVTLRQVGLGDCQDVTFDTYFFPPANLQPQLSRLTANATVLPGATVYYNFTLTNIGNLATNYVLTAVSDNWTGSAAAAIPSVVYSLGPGNSTQVSLRLFVPNSSRPADMEGSHLLVESTSTNVFRTIAYTTTTLAPQTFGVRLSPGLLRTSAPLGGTAVENATVFNDGNYADLITIHSTLPPYAWTIAFPSFPGTAMAPHSNISFQILIRPPFPFAGQLTWNTTINATASDGTTIATIVLNMTVKAPDVVVNGGTLNIDPPVVPIGEGVSATVVVSNRGNAPVENVTLELHDGTLVLSQLVSLLAGSAAPYSFSWTPTIGSHSITITADPGSVLNELNESNNSATGVYSVSGADLAMATTDIHFDDYQALNSTVDVEVNMRNIGGIRAWNISARALLSGQEVAVWEIPTIAGGESALFDFTVTVNQAEAVLEVVVDINGTVTELDETNNGAQVTVHGNLPPAATIVLSGYAQVGKRATFFANGSTDADGQVVQVFVDFGDGQTSGWVNGTTVKHNYTSIGPKIVTVKVRDDRGAESALYILNIQVQAADRNTSTTPPPSSPGLEAPAALGAIAAMAALALARRRQGR